MELVRGQPLTQYCDEDTSVGTHRSASYSCSSTDLRRGAARPPQRASSTATSNRRTCWSPTHRRWSPTVAKVIDFGIAKATEQRLTEKTLFTEFRQMMGTPEYMSPEQADSVGQLGRRYPGVTSTRWACGALRAADGDDAVRRARGFKEVAYEEMHPQDHRLEADRARAPSTSALRAGDAAVREEATASTAARHRRVIAGQAAAGRPRLDRDESAREGAHTAL